MTDQERELAEELERSRDDDGEWGEDRVDVDIRPSRSQVVSFRLPLEELEVLTAMTTATGESLSDFIRSAIEHRIRHVMAPSVYVTHTAASMTVVHAPSTSGRNEPDPFYVTELGRLVASDH
jgi:hypothetical protein